MKINSDNLIIKILNLLQDQKLEIFSNNLNNFLVFSR